MLSDTYTNPRWFRVAASLVVPGLRKRRQPVVSDAARERLERELCTRVEAAALRVNRDSEAEREWERIAEAIRKRIVNEGPARFLRWNTVEESMAVANAWFVVREYLYLRGRADWRDRWRPLLVEDAVGDPVPFVLHPSSSGNLVHHAWVAARFLDATGLRPDELASVTEFGGGYGSLSRFFRRLGFRGFYMIYDLEVQAALQAFYLQSLGIDIDYGGVATGAQTRCVFDPAVFSAPPPPRPSLFVALWSLSETSESTRTTVVDAARAYDYWLVGYQDRFGEVDNHRFIERWKSQLPAADWIHDALTHIPGHHLLIGTRRR
jgi:hypothetical protein